MLHCLSQFILHLSLSLQSSFRCLVGHPDICKKTETGSCQQTTTKRSRSEVSAVKSTLFQQIIAELRFYNRDKTLKSVCPYGMIKK